MEKTDSIKEIQDLMKKTEENYFKELQGLQELQKLSFRQFGSGSKRLDLFKTDSDQKGVNSYCLVDEKRRTQ